MSMVPPKKLNKIFPKIVTGSLLLLVGVYLISNGMQNWGGSSNCNGGTGFYALCPNIDARGGETMDPIIVRACWRPRRRVRKMGISSLSP